MSVDTQLVEELITQVEKLPPVSRLQLVQRVLHSLLPAVALEQPSILRFGEFAGDVSKMSREEDFVIIITKDESITAAAVLPVLW